MIQKQLICINCPRGCRVNISGEKDNYQISGNVCPRGRSYAVSEVENPRRTVTAAVPAATPGQACAAVRTSEPLPAALIPDLLNELYTMRLSEPAKRGSALISNYRGTGIDVIFTADFPA